MGDVHDLYSPRDVVQVHWTGKTSCGIPPILGVHPHWMQLFQPSHCGSQPEQQRCVPHPAVTPDDARKDALQSLLTEELLGVLLTVLISRFVTDLSSCGESYDGASGAAGDGSYDGSQDGSDRSPKCTTSIEVNGLFGSEFSQQIVFFAVIVRTQHRIFPLLCRDRPTDDQTCYMAMFQSSLYRLPTHTNCN